MWRARLVPTLALLAPAVGFLVAFFVVPVGYLVAQSMSDPAGGWNLSQYVRFLADSFYLGYLWDTLVIAVVTTLLCVMLGYPLAYQIARASAGTKSILIVFLLSPLMVGDVIRGYGWLIALGDYGFVNSLLMSIGIIREPIAFLFSPLGVVIGLTQALLPFMTLPLAGAIGSIPMSLEEAALSLGARPWRAFWRVVCPLSLPGLSAGIVIVFALAVSSFAIPLFLGGVSVRMIGPLIFQQAMFALDWPFAAAISVVLFAIAFLLLFVQMKLQASQAGRTPEVT